MSDSSFKPRPEGITWILLLIVMIPQLGLTLINPSNPTIAEDMNTSVSTIESTLTIYMVGYAVSMFISGTLADRFDASRLQSIGLCIFAVGCLVAAIAPTWQVLGVGRFLQAFGGTSATVLCRIIVQRRIQSDLRVDVLTSMSMVISLTPSLSPLLGGFAAEAVPWRGLFIILAVFSLALVPLIELLLGAAAPSDPELPSPSRFVFAIKQSVSNSRFRWYALSISLVWMAYFGFVSSSTTILQDMLGQSAISYGLCMAVPALGSLVGSMLVKRSVDVSRAVRVGILLGSVGILLNVLMAVTNVADIPLLIVAAMSITFLGVGATIPYAQAGLLELDLSYPGVSAGLFFFIQMASGAFFSAVLGILDLSTVPAYLLVLMVPQAIVTAMIASDWLRSRK